MRRSRGRLFILFAVALAATAAGCALRRDASPLRLTGGGVAPGMTREAARQQVLSARGGRLGPKARDDENGIEDIGFSITYGADGRVDSVMSATIERDGQTLRASHCASEDVTKMLGRPDRQGLHDMVWDRPDMRLRVDLQDAPAGPQGTPVDAFLLTRPSR